MKPQRRCDAEVWEQLVRPNGLDGRRQWECETKEELGDIEEGDGPEDFGPHAGEMPVTPQVTGEGAEDSGDGGRAAPLPAPRAPSRAEWERHVVSHVPYRSWCRHCVAGRGMERQHTRRIDHEDQFPHVSIDYGYLTGDATPLLVGKDRRSGMIFALAVERKGAADPQAVPRLAEWIDALGSERLKS